LAQGEFTHPKANKCVQAQGTPTLFQKHNQSLQKCNH